MTPNRPDLYAIDRFQLAAKLRQICRMKDSFTYDVLVVEKPVFVLRQIFRNINPNPVRKTLFIVFSMQI
jgi:hypothetical protein